MFGASFEYRIGSRKVSQREWLRHIEEEAREHGVAKVKDEVRRKLMLERCEAHNEAPRVSFRDTADGFLVDIEACCSELESRAQQAIST